MKTLTKNSLLLGAILSCPLIISSCDTLGSDSIPEIDNPDPNGNIKVENVDVYSLKNTRLGLDLSSAFQGFTYKGVSEEIKSDIILLGEGQKTPVIIYKNKKEGVSDFLVELENEKGNPVLANVNIKESEFEECGAENFQEVTIEKNTKLTIDLFLNKDLCGAFNSDTTLVQSTFTHQQGGNSTPGGFFNKDYLEGYGYAEFDDNGNLLHQENLSLYTFVPDSNFVGTYELEYAVGVNYTGPIDLSDSDTRPRIEVFNNPDEFEYHTQHKATIHVVEPESE